MFVYKRRSQVGGAAMRVLLCVPAVAGLMAVAGCTDDPGPETTSGPDTVPVQTAYAAPPPAEDPAEVSFVEAASRSYAAEPGAGEAADEYETFLEEIQAETVAEDSIAADLTSVEPGWLVDGNDVAEFVSTTCEYGEPQAAADTFLETIPGPICAPCRR